MTNQPTPRLVPDSIVKVADGSMIEVHGEGVVVCVSHMRGYGKSLEFPRGVPTTPEYTSLVASWLAFFAETGRLPTRDDDRPIDGRTFCEVVDQPKEAQGDE